MSTSRQEKIIEKGFIKSLLEGKLEIKDLAGINPDLDIARQAYLQGVLEATQAIMESVSSDMATAEGQTLQATSAKQDEIIDGFGSGVEASDTLRLSSDAEVGGSGQGWSKKKEIGVNFTGMWRVKFSLRADDEGYTYPSTAYGRIYLNGAAHGTSRSNSTLEYVQYSEDVWAGEGDLVQLYTSNSHETGGNKCKEFRLYADHIWLYGTVIT